MRVLQNLLYLTKPRSLTKVTVSLNGTPELRFFHISGVSSQTHDKQRSLTQNPGGVDLFHHVDYLPSVWLEQVIKRMKLHF
jgi:hypothetical protein